MPIRSVRASEQGLVRVNAALKKKGWYEPSKRYLWSIAASEIIDPWNNWE